jgi:hypothetical protein
MTNTLYVLQHSPTGLWVSSTGYATLDRFDKVTVFKSEKAALRGRTAFLNFVQRASRYHDSSTMETRTVADACSVTLNVVPFTMKDL